MDCTGESKPPMRPHKRYTLLQLFQMFAVFGVQLESRWRELKTPVEADALWNTAKAEAKTGYRNLCKMLHPDRNQDPRASEQMKEVTALWSILDNITPTFSEKPKGYGDMIHEMMQRAQQQPFRGATVVRIIVERVALVTLIVNALVGGSGLVRYTAIKKMLSDGGHTELLEGLDEEIDLAGNECDNHGVLEDPVVMVLQPHMRLVVACPWCSGGELLAIWEVQEVKDTDDSFGVGDKSDGPTDR